MPNHVAELEATVAQLSATVDGLREELVDANERIRELEQEVYDDTAGNAAAEGATDGLLPPPGSNGQGDDGSESETESTEQRADDIIVA